MAPKFDAAYMKKREFLCWRGPIVAEILDELLSPMSFLDVGCGPGEIVQAMLERGVMSRGLDSSDAAGKRIVDRFYFIHDDLTTPWRWLTDCRFDARFDIVLCLEVLSVIHILDRPAALSNLRAATRRWLVANHVEAEELPGFELDETLTGILRKRLEPWRRKQALKALARTACVFRRHE